MVIKDEWLEEYTAKQRTHLLSAFTSSCRRNQHDKTRKKIVIGGKVKSIITNVRSIFWIDPALDSDGKPLLSLTHHMANYTDSDPSKKQQNPLPVSVLRNLLKDAFVPLTKALGQLACGAFIFDIHSC